MANTQHEEANWTDKGAALSDKSARAEFGLTQAEIIAAVKAGKLQYRVNNMYGNPYLRLLRREVEALVREKHGETHLKQKKIQTELAQVNKALQALKRQAAVLEKRKVELLRILDEGEAHAA
jgi:hypothetical protein